MTDILPVNSFGGDGGGWSSAGSAFAGALIGSWFGDGFFGGRGGYNGGGNGPSAAVVADGFSTAILNDGVNAIQNSLNNINMNVSKGICDLGYSTLSQNGQTNLAMMQGFASLGHDNCQNTNSIVSAITNAAFQQQQCCCETRSTIREEGCATRELIQNNLVVDLQTKLCDAKSENAALKAQIYNTNLTNGQTAAILGAIQALRPTTTGTTTTA